MGTLEDIRDPIAVCREIQRVSKAGYISCPTRALESTIGVSKQEHSCELLGWFYHRWFVEIERGTLVFKAKNPLMFQNRQRLIEKPRQKMLHFFFEGSFEFEERYLPGHDGALEDLEQFHADHKTWLARGAFDEPASLSRYHRWPDRWGPMPNFSELD